MGAIIQRSVKRGNVLSFDESYKLGYKSAWASEVDEDFDILFNAWNSGLDGSLALADGSVTTAKLADNSVTEPKIAAGAVTDGKIASVSWSKLTGVPPLSATGPAGGVLTGTYPNPGLADHVVLEDNLLNEAVTSQKIQDGAITSPKLAPGAVNFPSIGNGEVGRIKISADAWLSPIPLGADVGKVLTVNAGPTLAWVTPTGGGGAPSGPAGGDLTGFYPNPLIGIGRVTDAMIAGVSWAKITGAPTSFPPSGSASGSLSGVYPNPSLAVNSVGQTQIVNGAVLRAKCAADTWLSPIPTGADVDKVLTVQAGPALAWVTHAGGGAPTGTAGGDLGGTYPNPTVVKAIGSFATGGPLSIVLSGAGQNAGIQMYAPTSSPARLRFGNLTPGNFQLYANVQLNNVLDDVGQPGLAWLFDGPAREFGFYSTPAGATAAWQYMCAISPAGLTLPNGILNIAGVNGEAAIFGARTVKHRIYVAPSSDVLSLAVNRSFAGVADDAAQPAWQFRMGLDNDAISMTRFPVGSYVTGTAMLTVASNGNLTTKGGVIVGDPALYSNIQVGGKGSISGDALSLVEISTNSQGKLVDLVNYAQLLFRLDAAPGVERATWYHKPPNTGSLAAYAFLAPAGLTLVGSTAVKASGTAWTNPSDRRLKGNIIDFTEGLALAKLLRPRRFTFNGKGGSQYGLESAGFIADEVLSALPEMVSTRRGKLDPDDDCETDIQMLDQSNLILVLLNAVKELATRVEALEV